MIHPIANSLSEQKALEELHGKINHLVSLDSNIEKDFLVKELLEKIVKESPSLSNAEIRFQKGREFIELRFNQKGKIVFYKRDGNPNFQCGWQNIDLAKLPAPVKYQWVSKDHRSNQSTKIAVGILAAAATVAYAIKGNDLFPLAFSLAEASSATAVRAASTVFSAAASTLANPYKVGAVALLTASAVLAAIPFKIQHNVLNFLLAYSRGLGEEGKIELFEELAGYKPSNEFEKYSHFI